MINIVIYVYGSITYSFIQLYLSIQLIPLYGRTTICFSTLLLKGTVVVSSLEQWPLKQQQQTIIAELALPRLSVCWLCSKYFVCFLWFKPHNDLVKEVLLLPHFTDNKCRYGKLMCQGHRAGMWPRRALNPGRLASRIYWNLVHGTFIESHGFVEDLLCGGYHTGTILTLLNPQYN